uniref:Uncharacterized protein n=1 Tax=Pristionchus pacificus TaxID=54126 RepID=A0A2A6CTZ1_PRIPA|eukprot:PDM81619.1 hypothetical protein PRIPAC_30600 [Pristionchus pacificus]
MTKGGRRKEEETRIIRTFSDDVVPKKNKKEKGHGADSVLTSIRREKDEFWFCAGRFLAFPRVQQVLPRALRRMTQ